MKILTCLAMIVTILALTGCGKTIEVKVYPKYYEVNELKSELATPIVDAVVNLNPHKIVTQICRNTPPSKLVQFMREIRAKSNATIQSAFIDKDCPEQ